MNRLEVLHIVTNTEFNNCTEDAGITRAWGYYIYRTGEVVTRNEFVEAIEAAHTLLKAIR